MNLISTNLIFICVFLKICNFFLSLQKAVDLRLINISDVNLGDIQCSTGTDANTVKLTRCCIWNNSISSQEPKEAFGYQTIKVSLKSHLFQKKILITRILLPILGKDFLEKYDIALDDTEGTLYWTPEPELTPIKFKLSQY